MFPSLGQILDYLNRRQIRTTYGAVGGVIGVPAQSVGRELGPRCPRTSWIVRASDGHPTGYPPDQKAQSLYRTTDIIRTSKDLLHRMHNDNP